MAIIIERLLSDGSPVWDVEGDIWDGDRIRLARYSCRSEAAAVALQSAFEDVNDVVLLDGCWQQKTAGR